MVTEYNKYLLNKRRMEEREKASSIADVVEKDKTVSKTETVAESVPETTEESSAVVEKKTDAEKIRRGRKKSE